MTVQDFDIHATYKIIYKDQEFVKPCSVILSSGEYAKFLKDHDDAKASEMIYLKGAGQIQKRHIEAMKALPRKRQELRVANRTRYERIPPTKEEFRALSVAAEQFLRSRMKTDPPKQLLSIGLLSMVISVWNFNDARTAQWIHEGNKIINQKQECQQTQQP